MPIGDFPGKYELSNLIRDDLSREIGRSNVLCRAVSRNASVLASIRACIAPCYICPHPYLSMSVFVLNTHPQLHAQFDECANLFLSLSLCLSLSLSLSLSLYLFISFSLSLPLSLCLSTHVQAWISV